MPIIEVDHVTKEFQLGELEGLKAALRNQWRRLSGQPVEHRAGFKALDDISFRVERGEVVGIIGHNGAGKSTLLKLLAGISQPTAGLVRVRGKVAPLIEVGAGFVPQLTGRENVYLNGTILGLTKSEIDRKLEEIVEFSEIEGFIDTPVKRYSTGMRVKLAFSVAINVDAEVLIIDEVLAVGDLAFQRKCFDRMESLIKRDGRTVLLVSHNIRQVERICSRVLLVERGRIRQDGSPRAVCSSFYEHMDQRVIEYASSQTKKARHQTTGEVDLLSIATIDSSGADVQEVAHLEPFAIRVRLRVNQTIRLPIFVIGFHTIDFIRVVNTTSRTKFRNATVDPGDYEVTVAVPKCPLTPGAYALRFSLDAEESIRKIYYADGLAHFKVRGNLISRTDPEYEGFFLLDADWNTLAETSRAADLVMPIA